MRRVALPPRTVLAALIVVGVLVVGALTTRGSFGGFSARITSTSTAGTAGHFLCAGAFTADRSSALFQYALNETSGTTAADLSGNSNTGTYRGSLTTSTTTPLACPRDTGGAYVQDGSTSYLSTNTATQSNPTTFSLEVWFKTTVASGRLMGFGSSQTGQSNSRDRILYLTTTGALAFGIYNTSVVAITSPKSYNDGAWHHVVATLAPSGTTNAGMRLYVDGTQVAANTGVFTPQNYDGWWRIGWDSLSGWPGAGSNASFTGSMRYAAVYTTALTAAQVLDHWASGQ